MYNQLLVTLIKHCGTVARFVSCNFHLKDNLLITILNKQLVIVNLQKTPYDNLASIRIFAKTDQFMEILMEELAIKEFDRETDILNTWSKKEGEEEEEEEEEEGPNYIRKFIFLASAVTVIALAYYFS